MINNVTLTGRLTRDIELTYTSNNKAVAKFILAVQQNYKNSKTGEKESDFIRCVAFEQKAEVLAKHTHKGSLIGIVGRIKTRRYDDEGGRTVFTTDVIVENVTFLEGKNSTAGMTFQQVAPQTPPSTIANWVPQDIRNINKTSFKDLPPSPMMKHNSPFKIDDTDLPF